MRSVHADRVLGHRHTTYDQVFRGVRAFSGVLKVHQDGNGNILSANGDFYRISPRFDVTPTLTAAAATDAARGEFVAAQLVVEAPELVIVDPGWYGDPPLGPRLAYYIVLRDDAAGRREAFFVDAHDGEVLDRWSLIRHALDRQVFDAMGGTSQGVLVRAEGDPPVGAPVDANRAYDYIGDHHGYLLRAFGFDSVDNAGLPMIISVNSTAPSPCPNAFWHSRLHLTVFCSGLVTDDILAHEFTHGLTQFSADLIGQNQSGQLDESFSDVFGELVDLFNGDAGFVGPPGGEPWPEDHATGSGTDTPNEPRGDTCLNGVSMRVNDPPDVAGIYVARAVANLGPRLTTTGITGDIVLAVPRTACPAGSPLQNPGEVNGKIAVIDVDGGCTVVAKATNAQQAGAIAVIITNIAPGEPASLNGLDNRIVIPLATLAVDEGNMLKTALMNGPVNVTMFANTPGASVRWLVGEDASIGAVRDMWRPNCFFDPDFANSGLNICGESDGGGVHTGNGVMNHAFAIATDGKEFRGFNVNGVGPIKTGAVWFRALTTYLTPASDFEDAYAALTQAALDLVGAFPNDPRTGAPSGDMFTADDAHEIDKALRAVALDTPARCGQSDEVLSSAEPPLCSAASIIFEDRLENGVNGWTVLNTGPAGPPTPYNWTQTTETLPFGRLGVAWFCADANVGDCDVVDETAVHSLISPPFTLPAEVVSPSLAFTHFMESQGGFDGGNVKLRVNDGPWQLLPRSASMFNPPNGRFFTASQGNTHVLAGEDAWIGAGGRWGTSIFSLRGFAAAGDRVSVRFDFAKNDCIGVTGWYVDDVVVFDCPDCDDDGQADQEELRFSSASPVLGNIGVGSPQSHTLTRPPPALSDVSLSFTVQGDFRNTAEFVTVDLNGAVAGTVFVNQASDCHLTPDGETLIVPAEVFNQAAGGGDVVIGMVGSAAVDPAPIGCDGLTYITVFVDYAIATGDRNGNGVLDACEGDVDGDNDVDLGDAAILWNCFTGPIGTITSECAPADLNADAHVDLEDVRLFTRSLAGPR